MSMSKELANLLDLKSAFISHCKTLGCEDNYIKVCSNKFDGIETALKNYEELLKRPCVLMGRTQGNTQAFIDTISKNYKEIKITNLVDEKKLNALEIIKEKRVDVARLLVSNSLKKYNDFDKRDILAKLTQEEFDLLKEVLK